MTRAVWLLGLWPIVGVMIWAKVVTERSLDSRAALLLPVFLAAGPFILLIFLYSRSFRL